MNNNPKRAPGDIFYEAHGVDRYARLSDKERRVWLHNLYLQFCHDQSTAYFAFEALLGACEPNSQDSGLGPEEFVSIPWWAARAIGIGWLKYTQDNADPGKAWGLTGSRKKSRIKSQTRNRNRNRMIVLDLLTLTKRGQTLDSAYDTIGTEYSLSRARVMKIYEQDRETKARFKTVKLKHKNRRP